MTEGEREEGEDYQAQAGSVKKGGLCVIKGVPCRVTNASTKAAKSGASKITITGESIFTGEAHEDTFPTSANITIPGVTEKQYEVADISEEGFVSLILQDGNLRQDLKLPAQQALCKQLQTCWDDNNANATVFFRVMSSCEQDKLVGCRWQPNEEQ